jgi:hypothetical protein
MERSPQIHRDLQGFPIARNVLNNRRIAPSVRESFVVEWIGIVEGPRDELALDIGPVWPRENMKKPNLPIF